MDERTSKLPVGSNDVVSPTDVYSQVMGEEKNGRVRMLGLGVSPTDEWGNVPSKNVPYRVFLQQQTLLEEINDKLNQQEERYAQLMSLLQDRQSSANNIASVESSSQNQNCRSSNSPQSLVVNHFFVTFGMILVG